MKYALLVGFSAVLTILTTNIELHDIFAVMAVIGVAILLELDEIIRNQYHPKGDKE